jgi:hypothetical protein
MIGSSYKNNSQDERNAHFGRHVKSHCGLIGIFIQNDRLEGIEGYCRRFE